jgi:hypothetical protein
VLEQYTKGGNKTYFAVLMEVKKIKIRFKQITFSLKMLINVIPARIKCEIASKNIATIRETYR